MKRPLEEATVKRTFKLEGKFSRLEEREKREAKVRPKKKRLFLL